MKNILRLIHLPVTLLIPTLTYLFILLAWESKGYYTITGDEPHYLMIMDSIVHDFDFQLKNNYAQETLISEVFESSLLSQAHYSPSGYSTHGVGIAILLAIPYLFTGVLGVKVCLTLFFGLSIPFIAYQIIYKITKSQLWSSITSLSFSCSLPFYAASNQIYADLVAGVFIVYAVYFLILCKEDQKALKSWITFLIIVSFLPWLKVSFILPFFILIAYGMFLILQRTQKFSKELFVFGIPIASIFLLSIYNYNAFQNPLNPYGGSVLTFSINDIGLAFLGLIYDQKQGILLQNLLLFFGFLGFASLFKENKKELILLAALYLSVNLPNSMLSRPSLYGGLSFIGRFAWSSISLWLFPLAHAINLAIAFRVWKNILLLTLNLNLLIQALFYSASLNHNYLLYNTNVQRLEETTNNLYQNIFFSIEKFFGNSFAIENLLPYYHDPANYAKHIPNYLFLALSIMLIYIGNVYHKKLIK